MDQVERDSRMHDLVKAMNDAYEFFTIGEQVEDVKARRDILKNLVGQTTECAFFIRDYAGDTVFGKSTLYATKASVANIYIFVSETCGEEQVFGCRSKAGRV